MNAQSSKQAYEQFRVLKFSGHPAHQNSVGEAQQGSAHAHGDRMVPDTDRVIIAFDIDCFYAQCEVVRNPQLRGKPVGVTQKYLVVTANYEARRAGVGKLMNIKEAVQKCPGLVLIPGEDLSPYRAASAQVMSVLSRYGPASRLGLDEVFVDVTQVVSSRLAAGFMPRGFAGHVHNCSTALVADTHWRPQDLRAVAPDVIASAHPQTAPLTRSHGELTSQPDHGNQLHVHARSQSDPTPQMQAAKDMATNVRSMSVAIPVPDTIPAEPATVGDVSSTRLAVNDNHNNIHGSTSHNSGLHGNRNSLHASNDVLNQQPQVDISSGDCAQAISQTLEGPWVAALQVGSIIAAEARAAVLSETGFRCSAGIACNKALAKLVSGLHKPDDQTVLPPTEAWGFLAPLPVRALPGCGYKTDAELARQGITTVAQLRALPRHEVVRMLGERVGMTLYHLARGHDPSPIIPQGPPKAITVEDSFKSCTTLQAAQVVLQVLAPDLLARVQQDCVDHNRWPATLTVKWRLRSEGITRNGTSTPWPVAHTTTNGASEGAASVLVQAAMSLMSRKLQGTSFCLTLINIGAANFKPIGGQVSGGCGSLQLSLRQMLQNSNPKHTQALTSQSVMMGKPAPNTTPGMGQDGASHLGSTGTYADKSFGNSAIQCFINGSTAGQGSTQPGSTIDRHHIPAAQLTASRRDYGSMPVAGLVSKSRERQLREGIQPATSISDSRRIGIHHSGTQQSVGTDHGGACLAASGAAAAALPPNQRNSNLMSQNANSLGAWPQQPSIAGFTPNTANKQPMLSPVSNTQLNQPLPTLTDAVTYRHRTMLDVQGAGNVHVASTSTSSVAPDFGLLDYEICEDWDQQQTTSDEDMSQEGFWDMDTHIQEDILMAAVNPDTEAGHDHSLQQSKTVANEHDHVSLQCEPVTELAIGEQHEPALQMRRPPTSSTWISLQTQQQQQQQQHQQVRLQEKQEKQQQPPHGTFGTPTPGSGTNGAHQQEDENELVGHEAPAHANRVVLHCDIDCMYCQVERLDDPSLVGVPLAVKQFNSGGFVSVSYEARAAGIRCGDGVGAGGRAAIPFLRDMGAVSEEEACARCPGLVVKPMRTDRYREVGEQVLSLLRKFAPGGIVEKTSYDDFYIDATELLSNQPANELYNSDDSAPSSVKVAGGGSWFDVCTSLRQGVALAAQLRQELVNALHMTMSVGVATNKMLARCVGPLNKPDCITVLPLCRVVHFMASLPIKSVPSLRGKTGDEVVEKLGVITVGELAQFSQQDLEAKFDTNLALRLVRLPLGQDGDVPVQARGPQKTILIERSYPPLTRFGAVRQALEPLVVGLWHRLVADTTAHARLPVKLVITWRQGYGNPRSKTTDMPGQVLTALRPYLNSGNNAPVGIREQIDKIQPHTPAPPSTMHAAGSASTQTAGDVDVKNAVVETSPDKNSDATGTATAMPLPGQAGYTGCHALLEAACTVFKSAVSVGGRVPLQITRLAVSAGYGKTTCVDESSQQRLSSLWAGSVSVRPAKPTETSADGNMQTTTVKVTAQQLVARELKTAKTNRTIGCGAHVSGPAANVATDDGFHRTAPSSNTQSMDVKLETQQGTNPMPFMSDDVSLHTSPVPAPVTAAPSRDASITPTSLLMKQLLGSKPPTLSNPPPNHHTQLTTNPAGSPADTPEVDHILPHHARPVMEPPTSTYASDVICKQHQETLSENTAQPVSMPSPPFNQTSAGVHDTNHSLSPRVTMTGQKDDIMFDFVQHTLQRRAKHREGVAANEADASRIPPVQQGTVNHRAGFSSLHLPSPRIQPSNSMPNTSPTNAKMMAVSAMTTPATTVDRGQQATGSLVTSTIVDVDVKNSKMMATERIDVESTSPILDLTAPSITQACTAADYPADIGSASVMGLRSNSSCLHGVGRTLEAYATADESIKQLSVSEQEEADRKLAMELHRQELEAARSRSITRKPGPFQQQLNQAAVGSNHASGPERQGVQSLAHSSFVKHSNSSSQKPSRSTSVMKGKPKQPTLHQFFSKQT